MHTLLVAVAAHIGRHDRLSTAAPAPEECAEAPQSHQFKLKKNAQETSVLAVSEAAIQILQHHHVMKIQLAPVLMVERRALEIQREHLSINDQVAPVPVKCAEASQSQHHHLIPNADEAPVFVVIRAAIEIK